MKTTIIILFLLSTPLTFAQSAVEYMESLTSGYSQMHSDMWDYTRSVSHGKSARKVEKRRMELITSAKEALRNAKSAKAFAGSTELRDSVVSYFNTINLVLNQDYAQLVDMEEVAEQSYDLMEAYIMMREMAGDKQEAASKMIGEEQSKFALANNINLIQTSSDLDKKMAVAGKVYDHYNSVYLAFFKSNKQELYLMDAISKQDVNAIEQNRNALLSNVKEGYEKLDTITLYSDDKRMVEATKKVFAFYQIEAEKGMEVVLDYFLKSENFQKVKASFDAIKEKSRTQQDVDAFNNAVNEMNAAVVTYNKQNDEYNSKRSKLIEEWNKAAESFTSQHVPKGK